MSDDADQVLRAAGWTTSHRRYGWWIDPASGDHVPEWRALEIARREAARRLVDAQQREAAARDGGAA